MKLFESSVGIICFYLYFSWGSIGVELLIGFRESGAKKRFPSCCDEENIVLFQPKPSILQSRSLTLARAEKTAKQARKTAESWIMRTFWQAWAGFGWLECLGKRKAISIWLWGTGTASFISLCQRQPAGPASLHTFCSACILDLLARD